MTSVNDMPADIIEAAAEIVDRINFVVVDPASVREDIARAILAERQRGIILTAWEREELLRYSECGEGFPSYGEKERSRWKALSAKLSRPKGS